MHCVLTGWRFGEGRYKIDYSDESGWIIEHQNRWEKRVNRHGLALNCLVRNLAILASLC
jgi:hypothetical protein